MRIFKAAAVVTIAAMALGTGFLGSRQAMAGTSSRAPLYVSKVHVGPPYGDAVDGAAKRQWVGRNLSDVVRTLGQPSQAYRLKDTGGRILVYAKPYQKHYVFEADPGRVTMVDAMAR